MDREKEAVLLIDFGSTFTKVTALDLDSETLIGRAQAPSTVGVDIMVGLNDALGLLERQAGLRPEDSSLRLACSSAAGGLRMVAIGLVPDLTAEAARQAALGAGAKLLTVFSFSLTREDLRQLEATAPDLLLLAGGTDGGNHDFILKNAASLAASSLRCPVIVAGNRSAAHEVCDILERGGKQPLLTENVLPELDRLNIEPARAAIREVFTQRIVGAKGLDGAESFVGRILMPTPVAVLEAARLLADGAGEETGMGDLLLVDVGGATTDVHSIGKGLPQREEVVMRGIPEPYAKRTVEGDLGLRYNARTIVDVVGKKNVLAHAGLGESQVELETAVSGLTQHTEQVPQDGIGQALDEGLARAATEVAVRRHAGSLESFYTPAGRVDLQKGKDLTEIATVIGTGGIFAWGRDPRRVLEAACFDPADPLSLRPRSPRLYVDAFYILYAIGLLAKVEPEKALRIAKSHLREISRIPALTVS